MLDEVMCAWEASGDKDDSTQPWTDFDTNTLGYAEY